MHLRALIQRLLFSPVFLFPYFVLTFGGGMQLLNGQPFSWERFFWAGIPFGLIMTVVVTERNKKAEQATGLSDNDKRRLLYKAVKTATLPADPELRKALPGYLDHLIAQNKKSQGKTRILLTIICLLNSFIAVASRDLKLLIFTALFAGGLIAVYRSIKKSTERINRMQRQLGLAPTLVPAPIVAAPKPPKQRQPFSSWDILRYGVSFYGCAIAYIGMLTCLFMRWDIVLKLSTPLIVLGALFILPYYTWNKRWQIRYLIALALATVAAVYGLHTSMGPNMTAPSSYVLPTEAHTFGLHIYWAVLRSTIPFILTSGLITLDIIFAKTKNVSYTLTRWAAAAIVFSAIPFVLSPIMIGAQQTGPVQVPPSVQAPTETMPTTIVVPPQVDSVCKPKNQTTVTDSNQPFRQYSISVEPSSNYQGYTDNTESNPSAEPLC